MNEATLLFTEINSVKNKRNKLILYVRKESSQRLILDEIRNAGIPILNINLLVSEQLRMLPVERRPFEVNKVLKKIVIETENDVICLHHIEYLFDPELKRNPVVLLESLSGNKVILAVWPGEYKDGILTYGTPEHPEFYQSHEYESYIFAY